MIASLSRPAPPLPASLIGALSAVISACAPSSGPVHPIDFAAPGLEAALAPLGEAIGDSRIVLLGENGHGVGEFSSAKVRLIEWLHERHGFEVVVFESGFFECGHAWRRIGEIVPERALYDCLSYAFQHAELVPLFRRIVAWADGRRPLELAGMDIQDQGFDSDGRPAALASALSPIDPALAARVASADTAIYLVEEAGGLSDDERYAWVLAKGDSLRALYGEAARRTDGFERWSFRLAAGLIDRLATRAEAEAAGEGRPARFYELRDEWMARAVAALADSIAGPRKVVVWLHNDHARYGNLDTPGGPGRSTGDYLRETYGDDVFSVGFFLGRGTITDNGRNEREVIPPDPEGIEARLALPGSPASYAILRGSRDPELVEWASGSRPYARMGIDPRAMVPADEFDALVYIDSIGPPDYRIDVPDGG